MTDEQHTFVFADLAGYTALTEAHGDELAAEIALEFCSAVNRHLPDEAEDIKMLGDACLLRIGEASEAVALGLQLTGEFANRHGFPDVRVGMHTGAAVRRGSDWFGSTVNVAARVAAIAGPGDVLLSSATWKAAAVCAGVIFEDRGTHELRHVSKPMHIYRARLESTHGGIERWAVDPVCHMRIETGRAAATIDHDGIRYLFCSDECAARFALSPSAYRPD